MYAVDFERLERARRAADYLVAKAHERSERAERRAAWLAWVVAAVVINLVGFLFLIKM